MSIGTSGRIVIEIEPDIKRRLYSALAKNGLTLKDWFLQNTGEYLDLSEHASTQGQEAPRPKKPIKNF